MELITVSPTAVFPLRCCGVFPYS